MDYNGDLNLNGFTKSEGCHIKRSCNFGDSNSYSICSRWPPASPTPALPETKRSTWETSMWTHPIPSPVQMFDAPMG